MALVHTSTLPTNVLEAVNIALQYMRETRIDDLALINTSWAVETAYAGLMQQSRILQTRGWFFNRYARSFAPDAQGAITLPANVVAADVDRSDYFYGTGPQPILRGNKMVDVSTGATTWTAPLKLTITELLEFEEMPEPFRVFVALQNASLCGQQVEESIGLSPFHQEAYQAARAEMMDMELANQRFNLFSTIPRPR